MKHRKQKATAVLLAGLLAVGSSSVTGLQLFTPQLVSAAAEVNSATGSAISWGNYTLEYYQSEDGTETYAAITGCKQNVSGKLVIPSEVTIIISGEPTAVPITEIAAGAFANCCFLTEVVIPDSVTVIGTGAFAGCSALQALEIPATVTDCGDIYSTEGLALHVTIGDLIFNCCDDHAEVQLCNQAAAGAITIPAEVNGLPVTVIAANAFQDCKSITDISIPDGVTTIGNWAFGGCSALEHADIPFSVIQVGVNSFADTPWLSQQSGPIYVGGLFYRWKGSMPENTELVIPEGIRVIAPSVLNSWAVASNKTQFDGLVSVTFPDSVEVIGTEAFHFCSNCKFQNLPANLKTLGAYALADTAIEEVVIPASCTEVGDFAFDHCIALRSVTFEEGVTAIGFCTFQGDTAITEIQFPASLRSIGESAFAGSGLTQITIPETVAEVGIGAFQGCMQLTDVSLPDNLTEIPNDLFASCSALTEITLPPQTTVIGACAFRGSGLTQITIPETVNNIGAFAFQSCALTTVQLPDGVTEIGRHAFSYNTGLTQFNIPDSVTSLGGNPIAYTPLTDSQTGLVYYDNWLLGCNDEALTHAVVADGTKGIAGLAFYGHQALEEIVIPESVEVICYSAFGDTYLFGAVEGYPNVPNLRRVEIQGSGLKRIEAYAFSNAESLCELNLPDSVEFIGEGAFALTALTELVFPKSLTSVDQIVFGGCEQLNTVTFLNPDCEIIETPSFLGYWDFNYSGTVCGYADSTAEAYAAANEYPFEPLNENLTDGSPRYTQAGAGDLNGNGTTDLSDAVLLARALGDISELSITARLEADLNGDGALDSQDLTMILQKLAGLPVSSDLTF